MDKNPLVLNSNFSGPPLPTPNRLNDHLKTQEKALIQYADYTQPYMDCKDIGMTLQEEKDPTILFKQEKHVKSILEDVKMRWENEFKHTSILKE